MSGLFGTDGVRGMANVELTPELAFDLGRAGAHVLAGAQAYGEPPRIMIGRDTRRSGAMLEAALTAGLCSAGARVVPVGVVPSPALAFLIKKYGLNAGVMISASHNPFEDNGIKFFDGQGYKLSDAVEERIEDMLISGMDALPRPAGQEVGFIEEAANAERDYIEFLKTTVPGLRLDGMKIAIDCANGATYSAAPALFAELGADVRVLHSSPDGVNINENCGSTHMGGLRAYVVEQGCEAGFAFDGDGDRCLGVMPDGAPMDGDEIMSVCACHMSRKGLLRGNAVAATVMSNLGFFIMGREKGITIEQTQVGDRYVLERMLEKGYCLGGEPSGHIIFLDHCTTGDGMMTALQLLSIMRETGKNLTELNTCMTKLPQVLVNARIPNSRKHAYLDNARLQGAIGALEERFAGGGRVLIRPSGTEPKVRVMIEGADIDEITLEAEGLARLMENELSEATS